MPEISLQNLTVFLIKPGHAHEQIIKDKARRSYQYFDIGNYRYHIYGKRKHDHPPSWVPFFEGRLSNNMFWQSDSPGVVLLLDVDGQHYALTFGQGRHVLLPDCYEDQFGLRVVLNSVTTVKSLEKKTFDQISGHTITQSAQEAEVGLFGFDIEKDLLRAVTGKLHDSTLGDRMSGVDSLAVSVRIELSHLPDLLKQYLAQSKLTVYKDNGFGFVDHMRSVTSDSLKDELDNLLIERINERIEHLRRNISEPFDFELIIPDILDYSHTTQFNYTDASAKHAPRQDINLNSFLEYKTSRNWIPTIRGLRDAPVYGLAADGTKTHTWKAYKCLVGEVDFGLHRFVLSDGNWFQISRDFVGDLDRFIEAIPSYDEQEFPLYSGGDEAQYNRLVANALAGFVNFDRQLLHPISGQRVEFCDLYTENHGHRDAIHVKHGTCSKVMSHLFSQGTTSAELYGFYEQSRQEAEGMIAEQFGQEHCSSENRPPQLRTVFAIIRRNRGKLPFFSKVNLRRACKDLHKSRQPYALAEIEYDPEYVVIRR